MTADEIKVEKKPLKHVGWGLESEAKSVALDQNSTPTTIRTGRKGSVIAARYVGGEYHREVGAAERAKRAPTNEEVAQAVQAKVAAAVETTQKYRHVAWYSLFVGAYLIILYLQASAYQSGEVISTLRNTLMPNGELSITFRNEDDVLAYLGKTVLLPVWKDPLCGDGNCEWPWEFPSYGRFGCRADCGAETNTTQIVINVRSDFVGHPTVSPTVLMAAAKWNLCLSDEARKNRGEADLCWFEEDKPFESIRENKLESMDVIDGTWYVIVKGDYAGRVAGNIYDLSNGTDPESIVRVETDPVWDMCDLPTVASPAETGAAALRKLMADMTSARRRGEEFDAPAVIERALKEVVEPQLEAARKRRDMLSQPIDPNNGEPDNILQKLKRLGKLGDDVDEQP